MTWTCDELITAYIAEKIRRGYDIVCSTDEIVEFLKFASYFFKIEDLDDDIAAVLNNYINGEGSKRTVWSTRKEKFEKISVVKSYVQDVWVPTYDLLYPSLIRDAASLEVERYNTFMYCMDLFAKRRCSQREIEDKIVTYYTVDFCNNAAAALVLKIWNSKIKSYIASGAWPRQCADIKSFIIDTDLAGFINLPLMRDELLRFFDTVSERIVYLARDDNDFKMSNFEEEVLAKSNFDLVMEGFDYIPTATRDDEAIIIDRRQNEMREIHNRYKGITTITSMGDERVRKLSKCLSDIPKSN